MEHLAHRLCIFQKKESCVCFPIILLQLGQNLGINPYSYFYSL